MDWLRGWLRPMTQNVRGDLFGGITTGIVALPLALALGVASGAGAAAGLYSAIFTGAIAALFGGTPAQISGPTAGMTAVLIKVYQDVGLKGLFAAMFLCGIFQLIQSFLKIGRYIHYLPRPVVAGFTNGIAILIFWNQFKDIFMPGGPMHTWPEMLVAAGVVVLIVVWPRITRAVPGSLVALVASTAAVLLLHAPVRQLGALPSGIPIPANPFAGLSMADMGPVVWAGFVCSLLGTIESLLAATVADQMSGTRHHSDREIFGQGLANAIAPLFGGLAGTGAIVRTSVNIRAGGRTPLSALVHSIMILGITLGLGKYAAVIPVPTLWGVLIATAIGMVEWDSVGELTRAPKSDSAVMLITTFLTVYEDLTIGVAAGLLLSFILFTIRMTKLPVLCKECEAAVVLRVDGPLFFGVARRFLEQVESVPAGQAQIWDLSGVTSVDATGAAVLKQARQAAKAAGAAVYLVGLQDECRSVLQRLEVLHHWPAARVCDCVEDALTVERQTHPIATVSATH